MTNAAAPATLRPIDIADAIASTAEQCAETLLAQGWEGGGDAYDIWVYHGDEEALAELIPVGQDERNRLQSAIRERLDAAHAAAHEG